MSEMEFVVCNNPRNGSLYVMLIQISTAIQKFEIFEVLPDVPLQNYKRQVVGAMSKLLLYIMYCIVMER